MYLVLVGLLFGLNLMSGLTGENHGLALWNMFIAGVLLVTAINKIIHGDN
jgi:hypothetical protein